MHRPGSSRFSLTMTCYVLGDGGLGNLNSELEQLAVDPRRAPQRVLLAHARDQLADVRRNRRPAGAAGARFPSPVPAKTFPVPADDCLRLHDDEGVQATGPQTIEPDPEFLVERCERGSRLPLSPQDRHLMAEGKDLELKLGSGPKPRSHDAEPKS